jgi:hypothetical protein
MLRHEVIDESQYDKRDQEDHKKGDASHRRLHIGVPSDVVMTGLITTPQVLRKLQQDRIDKNRKNKGDT